MAGAHVPVMLLLEVVGKAGIAVPAQKGPTGVKLGTVGGVIVMVIWAVVAQTPAVGVKV